jgi:hypothetical protein
MSDYVFPNWVVAMLKAPSPRTQMESSMIGLCIIMIGSLGLVLYMIFAGIVTNTWTIVLMSLSEVGILSFQFSMLSTTYQTYYSYKLESGMYPEDYKLKLKIEEAKRLKGELELSINKLEGEKKDEN